MYSLCIFPWYLNHSLASEYMRTRRQLESDVWDYAFVRKFDGSSMYTLAVKYINYVQYHQTPGHTLHSEDRLLFSFKLQYLHSNIWKMDCARKKQKNGWKKKSWKIMMQLRTSSRRRKDLVSKTMVCQIQVETMIQRTEYYICNSSIYSPFNQFDFSFLLCWFQLWGVFFWVFEGNSIVIFGDVSCECMVVWYFSTSFFWIQPVQFGIFFSFLSSLTHWWLGIICKRMWKGNVYFADGELGWALGWFLLVLLPLRSPPRPALLPRRLPRSACWPSAPCWLTCLSPPRW